MNASVFPEAGKHFWPYVKVSEDGIVANANLHILFAVAKQKAIEAERKCKDLSHKPPIRQGYCTLLNLSWLQKN